MKKNDYSDLFKDPRWQKRRLEIMQLKNFKCETCGAVDKELHVHHRFYIKNREIWEYDNDVFMLLCFDCHKKEHDKQNKEQIPDEYKELFNLINEATLKNVKFVSDLTFIVQMFCDGIYDDEFINLLAFALNNVDFIERLKLYLHDFYNTENSQIEIFTRIHLLEKQLKQLMK